MGEPQDWDDILESANPIALAIHEVAWELNEIKTILSAIATNQGCFPDKYLVDP
jgi:hypothetical protein